MRALGYSKGLAVRVGFRATIKAWEDRELGVAGLSLGRGNREHEGHSLPLVAKPSSTCALPPKLPSVHHVFSPTRVSPAACLVRVCTSCQCPELLHSFSPMDSLK